MTAPSPGWPADVVHVNEDGWVLINRGRAHGVAPGLRLLVVGTGVRDLRDLYNSASAGDAPPVVLRTRRTFELLEVIRQTPPAEAGSLCGAIQAGSSLTRLSQGLRATGLR